MYAAALIQHSSRRDVDLHRLKSDEFEGGKNAVLSSQLKYELT